MHAEFESEAECLDEEIESAYWFNRLVPKEIKEKDFRVSRRRPKKYED